MGGGKRMGEENVPGNAPSRKNFGPQQKSFWCAESWISEQENRATTPEGGGERPDEGGVPNPLLKKGGLAS